MFHYTRPTSLRTIVTDEKPSKETVEPASVEDPRTGGSVNRANPDRSLELALAAATTAAENGGTDIVVMDMSGHTAIFDYFIIATGTSRRQLHAMSEEIDHKLEDDLNDKRSSIDGYASDSGWIVLDYGTVVIHLFDEDTRGFYSLEALWAERRASEVRSFSALPGMTCHMRLCRFCARGGASRTAHSMAEPWNEVV